ncbi:NINE protein [Tunturiibacter lichenicola]|uniref:NINE protein n=1 Tax=Tunturiibacter lichenicola TaxID=2051959 RepID=UPI003D9BB2C4
MQTTDSIYTANMNEHQRAWFYAEYKRASKDETIGVLLALFLGGIGIHHFYLRRNTAGVIYLLLSWTGIPMVIAWFECFFMPGRVRQYNAAQAIYISNQILGTASPYASPAAFAVTHCPACNSPVESAAAYCTHCGAAITHTSLSTQPAL